MDPLRFALRFADTGQAVEDQVVESLLEAAIQAPTGRNGQPWLWHITPDAIHLYSDDPETLTDYQHVGAMAGLGAAIENLVLAAHHHHLDVTVETFPEPTQPTWVARIGLCENTAPQAEPHPADHLYEQITVRCTNRKRTRVVPLAPADLSSIESIVGTIVGAHIRIHTERGAIGAVADIFGKAGALHLTDPAFHRELISELRFDPESAAQTRDGIDVATLELGRMDSLGLQLCRSERFVRTMARVGGRKLFEGLFAQPVLAASAVALIWMDGHRPVDYLNGGRAMQRAWLGVAKLGWSLYPVSTLPYLFARWIRGHGEAMGPTMKAALGSLRKTYTQYFPVGDANGEILSFCLSGPATPTVRSLRKPLRSVIRIGDASVGR